MNKDIGLHATDLAIILEVLKQHPEVDTAIVFGSRAKGNYKNGSDVDLALKGNLLTATIILQISYLLNEETQVPFRFDVVNYHAIHNKELVEHIDRVGSVVYRCEKCI